MTRTRIKVCGITRVEDALAAARAGADAIGLNFWPGTPLPVTASKPKATESASAVPPCVGAVGLFVAPPADEVRAALDAVPLSALQFHGHEDAALCRSFDRPWLNAIAVAREGDMLESLSSFSDAMGVLLDDFDLYPDEMLSEVARRLGFGVLFDEHVGLASA